jgi:hypothetical protein
MTLVDLYAMLHRLSLISTLTKSSTIIYKYHEISFTTFGQYTWNKQVLTMPGPLPPRPCERIAHTHVI